MKALVKYERGFGNVELQEVEEPACGDDQIKIEVSYCGVCGTELHANAHESETRELLVVIRHMAPTVARLTTASYYSSCVTGRNPSAERAEPT